MKTPGCRNLFLYDCNPGNPLHWAYRIFIRKTEFASGDPLSKPELYAAMILRVEDMPTAFDCYAAGQDFGLNITRFLGERTVLGSSTRRGSTRSRTSRIKMCSPSGGGHKGIVIKTCEGDDRKLEDGKQLLRFRKWDRFLANWLKTKAA